MLPVSLVELALDAPHEPELVRGGLPHPPDDTPPRREVELQVIEERVDASEREAPTRVRSLVPREESNNPQHRLGVGVEDPFGQRDSFVTSVALDLALVGIELQPPAATVSEHGRGPRLEGVSQLAVHASGLAVKPQPEMPIRIGVTDEEPELECVR